MSNADKSRAGVLTSLSNQLSRKAAAGRNVLPARQVFVAALSERRPFSTRRSETAATEMADERPTSNSDKSRAGAQCSTQRACIRSGVCWLQWWV